MVLGSSQAERDTMHVFSKRGSRGMLTIAFMKSILKRFLRHLVGGQGLRDDARDYIRQHIPLRPLLNRREARATVETFGFVPIAMEHIVSKCQMQCSLIMCVPPVRMVYLHQN